MERFEEQYERPRGTFTLLNMFVAVTAIGILLALLLPASGSREPSRRNYCVNNMKQLMLALHNYHDVYRQFPNVTSTQIRGVAPGSVATSGNPGAGRSWLVATLPYYEETTLYESIDQASRQFSASPFNPAMKAFVKKGSMPSQYAAVELNCFRCLSSGNDAFATAAEYQALGKSAVAGCNYVALSATHLNCILGDPAAPNYLAPNGVLIPGPTVTNLRSIVDGSSKTLMLVETREVGYASWYDGTVSWVVGANPNDSPTTFNAGGFLLGYTGGTALNVGPAPNTSVSYLPAKLHGSIQQDWQWGPSSEHGGGVVIHGIADGSVRSMVDDIDPTLYLQLITRAGREKVKLPE